MGISGTLLATAWLVATCLASPMPLELVVEETSQTDLLVRKGIELAQSRSLEKRLSADFSMEKTWNNEVLFGGSWSDTEGDAAENTALSITCLECYTKGTVTARLWEDLFHPTVKLEFNQVEAYVFLGVETSASGTYSINLFASQSPIGLGFPGLSVGVVFYVDLVFSLSAKIDLTGGFYVKLADDAYLETDIFGGDITDSFFDGISSKSIPVTVQSGSATFKADLRLRVQCGAEASLPLIGIGSGAVVGIYANIIEFVAVVDSTPDCALETKEWWDLNAGAYAHLDVVVDYTTIGPVPTVSTTLLTAPTLTQCWIEAGVSSTYSSVVPSATTSGTALPYSSESSVVAHTSTSYLESSSITHLTPTSSPASSSAQTASITPAPVFNYSSTLPEVSSSRYPILNISTASNSLSASDDALVTSTIYSTAVYTLTSCAASVVNCPASYQKEVVVTQTVNAFTTICPASAQITTAPAEYSTTKTFATPLAAYIISTEQVVLLTPAATPVVNTFVPPTGTAPVAITAAATQKAAAVSLGPYHAGNSTAWPNSTGVTKPSSSSSSSSAVMANIKPSENSKSLSTQAPVTAGAAGSSARPFTLLVTELVGACMILGWLL